MELFYKGEAVEIFRSSYCDNGNLAVCLKSQGLPKAVLTVNIEPLPKEQAAVDTNNNPGALEFILNNQLGRLTDKSLHSGYCIYPVVQFNLEQLPSLF